MSPFDAQYNFDSMCTHIYDVLHVKTLAGGVCGESFETKWSKIPKAKINCHGKSGLFVALKMCASTCMVTLTHPHYTYLHARSYGTQSDR